MDSVSRTSGPKSVSDHTETILRRAVEIAKNAPSGHNMQPWRFRLGEEHIDIFADRKRALPVLDPEGRELTISCGVALFYLQLALRHEGVTERTLLLPDATDPDWLARVQIKDSRSSTAEEFRLYEAIPRRRTNRLAFYDRPLSEALPAELAAIAHEEGICLQTVTPTSRQELIHLITQGAQQLAASVPFREEFVQWSEKASEMFDPETGVTNFPGDVSRHLAYSGTLVSSQNPATLLAAQESRLAQEAPLIVALSSEGDTPLAWLSTGQALAHILLHAATAGVMAAFLNTPIQVKDLRRKTAQVLEMETYPQLILALGHAPYGQRTPRRSVEDILL